MEGKNKDWYIALLFSCIVIVLIQYACISMWGKKHKHMHEIQRHGQSETQFFIGHIYDKDTFIKIYF